MWLAQGNLAASAGWAQASEIKSDGEFLPVREAEYVALARVLLAQGLLDAALTLLERLRREAETHTQVGRLIEMLVVQALVLRARGDAAKALATLERALSLAEPEGYTRVFLDEGEPMVNLLRHAGSRGIAPGYVSKLLGAFAETVVTTSSAAQPLIERLSDRELEVLRLLATGKSNQDIADELVLATGTVKKHLNSIFGKLNVESRTQCVARARELNLL